MTTTTKIYVLIYDTDNGNREDCNIFYSPVEVFADAATRDQRIDYVSKNSQYEIGFRTEDLEFETTHDFELPEHLKPDPDEAATDDTSDDTASEDDNDDATQPVTAHMPPEEEAGDGFIYGERSWLSVDPEEYLFSARLSQIPVFGKRATLIHIVPVRYWNEHNQLCVEECRIDLPFEFEKLDANCYMYDGTPSAARGKLREMGILEDQEFNDYCANQ